MEKALVAGATCKDQTKGRDGSWGIYGLQDLEGVVLGLGVLGFQGFRAFRAFRAFRVGFQDLEGLGDKNFRLTV